MKNFRIFMIAIIFQFSPIAGMAAVESLCSQYLETYPHELVSTAFSLASDDPSVRVVHRRPGPNGGEIITLKMFADSWLSQFTSNNFDIQGDPRWFILAYGEKVAELFGFKILSPKLMTIPDATEFQAVLDKVNSSLIILGYEPILLRFANTRIEKPLQDYIDSFLAYTLPIASDGNHLIHDMSFHSGAFLIPNNYVELAVKRTQFMQQFMAYLKTVNSPYSQKILGLHKYIKFFQVRDLDNGTAFENIGRIALRSEDSNLIQQMTLMLNRKAESQIFTDPLEVAIAAASHLGIGRQITLTHPSKEVTLDDFVLEKDTTIQMFTKALISDLYKSKITGGAAIWRVYSRSHELREMDAFLQHHLSIFSQNPEGHLGLIVIADLLFPDPFYKNQIGEVDFEVKALSAATQRSSQIEEALEHMIKKQRLQSP